MGVFLKDKKDNPVSLCYAAAIAGEKAEIDVITNEQYRGKGLAKRIVTLFIDRCLEKDLTTSWDCFPENIASLNTAIGLNFTEKKSYNFLSIYRK